LSASETIPLHDEGGRVFAEPWQAQAFALAVRLSAQGHFTWKEWADTLAAELQSAADRGEPDDGSRYYHHWLAALERLVSSKGLADPAALLERKEAWADAYRHTPHGKPVELKRRSGQSAEPIAPPEPDLTPAELLRRAEAMCPMLRERQAACEEAGRISDETNAEFIRAGFYRILQPRRFGGYEFDLPCFLKVMLAVSRGCPESGWVLALTAGHAYLMSLFPEAGQREAFGASGEFRAPAVALPGGTAVAVEGGYRVKGAWDYASGCDLATHFIGATMALDPQLKAPQGLMYVLFDRDQYSIVDNWRVMGMQGTGSRRVVIDEIFVPADRVLPTADAFGQPIHQHPGHAQHRNPMYQGRVVPLLVSETVAVAVGGARGALDVYEEILRRKKRPYPPSDPLADQPEFQRHFGQAQSLIDTAEAALLQLAANYMEQARRQAEDGIAITDEEERRLLMIEQQCVRLAWEAMELMFRTAGSSSAASSAPLGRYFRNLAVIRTHITLQIDRTAVNAARLHFGMPAASPL
jgi:3-hydroxy-9,10-secoandrosta-1,3,5(10)-triene-9,17-dione monooxygenase